MKKIAKEGHGLYTRANNNRTGLKEIFNNINSLDKQEIEVRSFKEYNSWFQIFVAIAFFILVLELIISERKSEKFSISKIFETNKERKDSNES